jgi:hypothetical protein
MLTINDGLLMTAERILTKTKQIQDTLVYRNNLLIAQNFKCLRSHISHITSNQKRGLKTHVMDVRLTSCKRVYIYFLIFLCLKILIIY